MIYLFRRVNDGCFFFRMHSHKFSLFPPRTANMKKNESYSLISHYLKLTVEGAHFPHTIVVVVDAPKLTV